MVLAPVFLLSVVVTLARTWAVCDLVNWEARERFYPWCFLEEALPIMRFARQAKKFSLGAQAIRRIRAIRYRRFDTATHIC